MPGDPLLPQRGVRAEGRQLLGASAGTAPGPAVNGNSSSGFQGLQLSKLAHK